MQTVNTSLMFKNDIEDVALYLIDNNKLPKVEGEEKDDTFQRALKLAECLDTKTFVQYWLEWHGIIGYASDISRIVLCAFGCQSQYMKEFQS